MTVFARRGAIDPSRLALEDAEQQLLQLLEQRRTTLGLLDRAAALRTMPHAARELAGVDVAFVGTVEQDEHMTLRNIAGNRTPLLQDLVIHAGRGLGGAVWSSGRPASAANYTRDRSITHDFDRQVLGEGITAVLAVPIAYDSQVFGVLYGSTRAAHEFSDYQFEVLERLGRQAGGQLHIADRAAAQTEAAVHEERTRLSAELHDSLGAMLFTIGAEVRELHEVPGMSPELAARLERISSQVSDAGCALRESLTALTSGPATLSLAAGLRADCRAFSARTGTRARAVLLSDLPQLDDHRSAALSATVREALVNVEKHACAQNVVVTAVASEGGLLVAVADDGQGAEVRSHESSGLGLANAQARLEQVGGRLSCITDDEDHGWTVRAWVPAAF